MATTPEPVDPAVDYRTERDILSSIDASLRTLLGLPIPSNGATIPREWGQQFAGVLNGTLVARNQFGYLSMTIDDVGVRLQFPAGTVVVPFV
jgi:hypothetical protein